MKYFILSVCIQQDLNNPDNDQPDSIDLINLSEKLEHLNNKQVSFILKPFRIHLYYFYNDNNDNNNNKKKASY